jgi:hypothetical protein
LCSGRHGAGTRARHQHRHPGRLGGQRKAPGGDKIIGFRLSPQLDNHRIERVAARALKACLKRVPSLPRTKQNDPRRIDTQLSYPKRGRLACLSLSDDMANPKAASPAQAMREHQPSSGKTRRIRLRCGVDLV